jgi:outer membrane lipoprotein-sorting protein
LSRFYVLAAFCALLQVHFFQRGYEESLEKAQSKFRSIHNYHCTFVSFSSEEDKKEEITYGYYYCKPCSVRLEVRTGPYEGTVLLYTGGTVRLKVGYGILSWFSFSFDQTDKIVCDLRGNGIHQSDWGWYIEQHLQFMPQTRSSFAGIDTINDRQTYKYELVSKDPNETRSVATEYMWVDIQEDVILRYEQYDSTGKLIQSGLYKDIVIDSVMSDSLFVEFEKKE